MIYLLPSSRFFFTLLFLKLQGLQKLNIIDVWKITSVMLKYLYYIFTFWHLKHTGYTMVVSAFFLSNELCELQILSYSHKGKNLNIQCIWNFQFLHTNKITRMQDDFNNIHDIYMIYKLLPWKQIPTDSLMRNGPIKCWFHELLSSVFDTLLYNLVSVQVYT